MYMKWKVGMKIVAVCKAPRRRAAPRRAAAHCRRRGKNTTPLCNGANVIMNLHLIIVPLRSDVKMCYEFLMKFTKIQRVFSILL